ncbi:MAG: galactose-1-phosphate uridylyltransferase [Candidatus Xenobia bacterium]
MSELRYNTATRDWVIVAPERSKRPQGPRVDCPFCPGAEEHTPDESLRFCDPAGNWLVRSFPNGFPVMTPQEGELWTHGDFPELCRPSAGRHEVVAESPRHDDSLARMQPAHLELVLRAWRDRSKALLEVPGIDHIIVFKNHGEKAGSSLSHPHSQIVGLPVMPVQVQVRLEEAVRSYSIWGRCLYCQMIDSERAAGQRIVAEVGRFTAFVPFAAFSPYSLWIFPRQHAGCFSLLSDDELPELAALLGKVLGSLDRLLGDPAYNLVVRSISCHTAGSRYFHYYLAVVPRLGRVAGFELGTGMFINPHLPEEDARQLREA